MGIDMVLSNTYIDEGALIGPNAVIGAEGLEAQFEEDQTLLRIAHVGGAYIGPGVSIMSNSVVSRDVYHGFTRVGAGTMVGPLCNIGHRSSIGEGVRIAGNATIGGSAVIGDKAWIGPSATISNGVTVGEGARVSLGSVVVKAVKPGQRVSGRFACNSVASIPGKIIVLRHRRAERRWPRPISAVKTPPTWKLRYAEISR